jgi:transcriptional regulator with XRE-family HTH domain
VTTFERLWPKLKRSKRYREAFVAQHAKQEIGTQIRALLKQHKLTQAQLATRAGLTQGVVSRAADPSYGNLTINTLVRIAAGFDVAFVGRFVPFSELPKWFDLICSEDFTVLSFEQEDASLKEQSAAALEKRKAEAVAAERLKTYVEPTLRSPIAPSMRSRMARREAIESAQLELPLPVLVLRAGPSANSQESIASRQPAPALTDNLFDFIGHKQRFDAARIGTPMQAQSLIEGRRSSLANVRRGQGGF